MHSSDSLLYCFSTMCALKIIVKCSEFVVTYVYLGIILHVNTIQYIIMVIITPGHFIPFTVMVAVHKTRNNFASNFSGKYTCIDEANFVTPNKLKYVQMIKNVVTCRYMHYIHCRAHTHTY